MAVASLSARSSSLRVWLSTAAVSRSSLPSSDSVCAFIAASMAASLVSRVVFWSVRTPLIWSSFPSMSEERLSMAVVSLSASSSSLRVWLPTAARRRSSLPSRDSV